MAKIYRPKLIVCGGSAYSRLIDFQAMRKIADSVKAYLLADVSHTAGLMSAEVIPGPFEHADVVMTTTHKSYYSLYLIKDYEAQEDHSYSTE
jgi:glycine hydroxymethyltransferase